MDTGSTDRTKELAAEYTDNIYDFEWIGDFSAARNFAAGCASHDLLFPIDTDEILSSFDWNDAAAGIADASCRHRSCESGWTIMRQRTAYNATK